MNCKETQAYIGPYIEEKMDMDKLPEFMKHIDTCPECKDELEVRFLVREGLLRLEDGETFDMKKELNRKLEISKRMVFFGGKIQLGIYIIESFAGMILAACMMLLLIH